MSNMSKAIHENSEKFLPAFARLRAGDGDRPGRYAPLDFYYQGSSPRVASGETELGRWVVVGGCMFTVTDAGTPMDTAPVGSSGRPLQLFYGGAEALLTDRRLLAVVVEGETVVGAVGKGSILALSFPLTRIESVSVDLKSRLLGGVKETRLHVMSMDGTLTDLFFDDVVAVPGNGSRGYERFRGTKREILEAFVRPVVAARRPGANEAQQRQLLAAEQGARQQTADEIGVQFVPD
jgi:hypothetical protein